MRSLTKNLGVNHWTRSPRSFYSCACPWRKRMAAVAELGSLSPSHLMALFIIIGAALGALVTWALCKFFYEKQRRHYLRDTPALMQRSMEIQDEFYATH